MKSTLDTFREFISQQIVNRIYKIFKALLKYKMGKLLKSNIFQFLLFVFVEETII